MTAAQKKAQAKRLKALRKRFRLGEFKKRKAISTLKRAKRALQGLSDAFPTLLPFDIDTELAALASGKNIYAGSAGNPSNPPFKVQQYRFDRAPA